MNDSRSLISSYNFKGKFWNILHTSNWSRRPSNNMKCFKTSWIFPIPSSHSQCYHLNSHHFKVLYSFNHFLINLSSGPTSHSILPLSHFQIHLPNWVQNNLCEVQTNPITCLLDIHTTNQASEFLFPLAGLFPRETGQGLATSYPAHPGSIRMGCF